MPPQRRPVHFQAGQSDAGVSLGARFAEVVYTSQPTFEAAQAFVADVQQRARRFGREQHPPLIMNSFHAIIGESDADVARRLRDLPLYQPLPAAGAGASPPGARGDLPGLCAGRAHTA